MAFDRTNLYPLSSAHAVATAQNANAPRIWGYVTTDTVADINTADYFLGAIDLLRKGDLIFANTATGGTMAAAIFSVNANTGTSIDVTDGLAIGTTDSD